MTNNTFIFTLQAKLIIPALKDAIEVIKNSDLTDKICISHEQQVEKYNHAPSEIIDYLVIDIANPDISYQKKIRLNCHSFECNLPASVKSAISVKTIENPYFLISKDDVLEILKILPKNLNKGGHHWIDFKIEEITTNNYEVTVVYNDNVIYTYQYTQKSYYDFFNEYEYKFEKQAPMVKPVDSKITGIIFKVLKDKDFIVKASAIDDNTDRQFVIFENQDKFEDITIKMITVTKPEKY